MYFGNFDMSIHENMLSRPSNHFCQPTHSGGPPQSRAMAPMSTLSMSTITRPETNPTVGYKMHHLMGTYWDMANNVIWVCPKAQKRGDQTLNWGGLLSKPWDLWIEKTTQPASAAKTHPTTTLWGPTLVAGGTHAILHLAAETKLGSWVQVQQPATQHWNNPWKGVYTWLVTGLHLHTSEICSYCMSIHIIYVYI